MPPVSGTLLPLKANSTSPALPVKNTTSPLARIVFTSGGLIMPRTTYLPSDLTETQARSFGRIVISNSPPAGAASFNVAALGCVAAARGCVALRSLSVVGEADDDRVVGVSVVPATGGALESADCDPVPRADASAGFV